MPIEEPKFVLVVIVPKGLTIRDTPRPESDGGIRIRTEPVGKQLFAYSIHKIGGVPYARLVPQISTRMEWVRVAEADNSTIYADVIPLENGSGSEQADAIRYLGDCIVKAFQHA